MICVYVCVSVCLFFYREFSLLNTRRINLIEVRQRLLHRQRKYTAVGVAWARLLDCSIYTASYCKKITVHALRHKTALSNKRNDSD